MPSPSDLAWWQWLLVSIGSFVVAAIIQLSTDDDTRGCMGSLLVSTCVVVGLLTGVVAIIRFVKFVWQG